MCVYKGGSWHSAAGRVLNPVSHVSLMKSPGRAGTEGGGVKERERNFYGGGAKGFTPKVKTKTRGVGM